MAKKHFIRNKGSPVAEGLHVIGTSVTKTFKWNVAIAHYRFLWRSIDRLRSFRFTYAIKLQLEPMDLNV